MVSRKKIPERSVERICRYREILLEYKASGKENIFSHELAEEVKVSSAQVRRDLMYFTLKGMPQQGYPIKDFLAEIEELIDPIQVQKVLIVGIGNLGKAILSYFSNKRPKLSIVAAFDIDKGKENQSFGNCTCLPMKDLPTTIIERGITVGIITVPSEYAQEIADLLIANGIKGILNFAPIHIQTSPSANVFLENIDITTSLEKTAYFARIRSTTPSTPNI